MLVDLHVGIILACVSLRFLVLGEVFYLSAIIDRRKRRRSILRLWPRFARGLKMRCCCSFGETIIV